MIRNEFNFDLKTEISYVGKDNQKVDSAQFITLRAPTVRQLRLAAPLTQALTQCIIEQQQNLTNDDRENIGSSLENTIVEDDDGDDKEAFMLAMMIASSKTVDYGKALEDFVKLLKLPEIALIDGETQIKDSFLDRVPLRVIEDAFAQYIANFIAPSL